MHPKRKQRLFMVLSILIGASVATGLILYAFKDSLNLFYPPSDIVAGKAPVGVRIRAGGMVEPGSVIKKSGADNTLEVSFNVTDYEQSVTIEYQGILPDLFAEGEGVVVAGILTDDGKIIADEVLAKHDENYMPPEVQESLKMPHDLKTKEPTE